MPFSIEDINRIAAQVVPEPPGLIYHEPEPWALPRACFANAWRKVELSGGRHRYGWTFHLEVRPGVGEYLFLPHAGADRAVHGAHQRPAVGSHRHAHRSAGRAVPGVVS